MLIHESDVTVEIIRIGVVATGLSWVFWPVLRNLFNFKDDDDHNPPNYGICGSL